MDERLKFVAEVRSGEFSLSELCRAYGVSRKTGYKWVARYESAGPAGLLELSRAPHHRPDAVVDDVVQLVLAVRKRWPTWGPRKILAKLEEQQLGIRLPAASTVARILGKHGFVHRRRRRYCAPPGGGPFARCDAPNDVWCADFKGRLILGNKHVCHPFTLSDANSRYLLRCEALSRTTSDHVQPLFESAFREFGLPLVIRTDNGPPFSTVTAGGLSRIAVWLVKLGVRPERIEPGKPTQNGRHERIHRTLREDAANPPAANMATQQRAFDEFRRVYNNERPHEALGQKPPFTRYETSPRPFPTRLKSPEYGPNVEVRSVHYRGYIKWRGAEVYLSETLQGEPVSLEEIEGGWSVKYGPLLLGRIDAKNHFRRPMRARPGERKVSPMSSD